MRKFNVAVIGAGRIGSIHISNLMDAFPSISLSGVHDPDSSTAENGIIKKYNLKYFTSDEEIWHNPDIEAVIISSPTKTHLYYINRAALAGKQIFCEKPIGDDIPEIRKILKTITECNVSIMIGFNRRFDNNFLRARQAVMNGEIGDPHLVKITSRDPHPPSIDYIKTSGGLFFDMSIHDWDMARFLMGCEVESVYAAGSNLIDPEIGRLGDIDTAVVILRFVGGGIAVIDNSRKANYGYDQRIEVLGSRGSVRIENPPLNTAKISTADGIRCDNSPHFFINRYMQSYRDELQAFFESLEQKTSPPVSGEDGLAAVAIARAALISYRENRPVFLGEI